MAAGKQFDTSNGIEHEDWIEQKARALADHMLRLGGRKLIDKVEVVARALEMISPSLPSLLVAEWLDVATEQLVETIDADGEPALARQLPSPVLQVTTFTGAASA
jgi:hypothetical protein